MNLLRNRWFALIASMIAGYLGRLIILAVITLAANDRFGREEFFCFLPGILFGPLYFLPTIIGLHKRNALAICVVNTFLGLTGVGWVAALIWAVLKEQNSPSRIPSQQENYYEPRA